MISLPDAFEVILEPDNSDQWRGREIGLGLVAAAKRLRTRLVSRRLHCALDLDRNRDTPAILTP